MRPASRLAFLAACAGVLAYAPLLYAEMCGNVSCDEARAAAGAYGITTVPLGVPGTTGIPSGGGENPESCNELFGLRSGTIRTSLDKSVMNEEVCDAYKFLISRYDVGGCSSRVPNAKTNGITSLNPDFAVALAKMLRASPGIRINSAYRNAQAQNCANPGSPNSNHTKGCAVDLLYSQKDCGSYACRWVDKNSAQFGLHIRMRYSPEWNHVEPINIRACQTGGPGVGEPSEKSPSAGLSSAIRKAVNPQPASQAAPAGVAQAPAQTQPAQTPPPLGTMNSTPYAPGTCSPQFYCVTNNLYYRASTCVDQMYQACPNGCSGTSCIASAQSVSTLLGNALSTTTATSTIVSTSTRQATSTAFDRIQLILNPVASAVGVAATSAPLVLIVSGEDAAHLEEPSRPQSAGQFAPGTIYATQPPASQQTFISQDLSQTPGVSGGPAGQSTFQKALTEMKATVLRILEYLRPFGLRQAVYGQEEFAE